MQCPSFDGQSPHALVPAVLHASCMRCDMETSRCMAMVVSSITTAPQTASSGSHAAHLCLHFTSDTYMPLLDL